MVKISVIIPTYNTGLLIKRALESVLEQTCECEFEVLVVDDASTDDTISVVEAIGDSKIRIFRQAKNQGPAAARNRGLKEATGKYCAFLDGDDYWEPAFLQETVSFLEEHPDMIAVSVMQCHKIIGKEPTIAPSGIDITDSVVLDDFFEFWGKFNHVCTGSVLFRKDIAMAIGGQREDLRICEDLEFWAMLATYGKWGFIPKVLFTSDGGAVTRQQGWLEKNMRRWKNAPSVFEWRKRIEARKGSFDDTHLEFALGRIARNLCYCHVMSGKDVEAQQEVQAYGDSFPNNHVNRVFRCMAYMTLTWKCWCFFLRWREFRRNVNG